MRTLTLPLLAAGLLMTGCDGPTPTSTELKVPATLRAIGQGNGVIHRVSVGSHDQTPPGVDANFSLIAIQHRDGSVTGQWTDQFGHGFGGLHIAVDCLAVDGNQAWISGIATKAFDEALVGTRWATRVQDNGTSANDPPDQISFSVGPIVNPAFNCQLRPNFPLFDLDGGEVKVD